MIVKSQKGKNIDFLLSTSKTLFNSNNSFIEKKVHFQYFCYRYVLFETYKSTFLSYQHLVLMNFFTWRVILNEREV
jgi:hypothetical protein